MMTKQSKLEFEERLATFLEGYTEEETDTFARSLVTVGDMVEAGFGGERAAGVMNALLQVITAQAVPATLKFSGRDEWRQDLVDMNVSADTNFPAAMQRAQDLNSFAYYGILASWARIRDGETEVGLEESITDVPAYVEGTIAGLEKFMSLFGKAADTWGFDQIERTILAARGRLKIDQNQPLSVHELAALSKVITKRLQNAMYTKSDEAPIANENGLIAPASAERWLNNRAYLPSIWQSYTAVRAWNEDPETDLAEKASDDTVETDEFLFVPEAADGTVFGPSCGRESSGVTRYTIGEKGDERSFDNFEEALNALTKMVVPRWRRPNPRGIYGIVRAERWRRVSRAQLTSL